MGHDVYSQEEKTWLRKNYRKHDTLKSLWLEFSKHFEGRNYRSVQCFCYRQLGFSMKKRRCYTQEESNWVFENYHKYKTIDEVYCAFKNLFGNVSKRSFSCFCNRRNLIKEKKGEYNARPYRRLPIGTEVLADDGRTWVKLKDYGNIEKQSRREPYWMLKERKIYTEHYGKIPKDGIIIFLDGNKSNYDITNLYCTKKGILALLCRNQWFSTDAKLTLTAIKCCELMQALKGV